MTGRFKDLSGQTIGALLIIERVGSETRKNGSTYATWLCQCACGRKVIISTHYLIKRKKPDCGNHGRAKKHGHSGNGSDQKPTQTYRSWANMISRCTQPSYPSYQHYKERGITICERWRKFENFLEDMGERPGKKREYTIERIDNDKGYEPGNCKWATWKEQGRNRTPNDNMKNPASKLTDEQVQSIRLDGRTQRKIADELGISQSQVSRIKLGKQRKTVNL